MKIQSNYILMQKEPKNQKATKRVDEKGRSVINIDFPNTRQALLLRLAETETDIQ